MKSLEELKKLRDEAKKKINMRDNDKNYRVVVGMGTCGIASGARAVLNALVEETSQREYSCVVTQAGCIGMCTLEPLVDVYDVNGVKTTYVHVDEHKAREILKEHVGGGQVLVEYTVTANVK